jgi:hypothetical protein
MSEPLYEGPVVYPPWVSANYGDEVMQGSRGLVRRMGTILRPWSTTGTVFTYESDAGTRTVEVRPPANANGVTLPPGTSLIRVDTAEHFGLSLIRPVGLARVGDEVRDLDAATALTVGTLLGTGNAPSYVVVGEEGEDDVRSLFDLRTGQAIEDLYDPLVILYLAPRPAPASIVIASGDPEPQESDEGS